MAGKKKDKAWVAGRGVKGLADSVPSGIREIVSGEEKEKAAKDLAAGKAPVGPGVVSSKARKRPTTKKAATTKPTPAPATDSTKRLIEMVTDFANAATVNSVKVETLAQEVGFSKTFIRHSLKNAENLQAVNEGLAEGRTVQFDGTELKIAGATSTAPMPEKVTVRAEPVKPDVVKADKDYFYFDPLLKMKLETEIAEHLNVWITGPTGTGKSEIIERLCEKNKQPFFKVSFNGESSVDDLLGHYVLRGGDTIWQDGALPRAMESGAILICEEIDAAPAEANLALQRALEVRAGRARHFYNSRNGKEVEAADGFSVVATANTAGGGDHTGLYAGLQVQNAAFRNRFCFEHVDYPTPEIEVKILRKRTGLDATLAKKVVKFAGSARDAVTTGDIFTPVSTRTLIAFGSLYIAFSRAGMDNTAALREALNSTIFYQAASPTDATALAEFAQRVFGELA